MNLERFRFILNGPNTPKSFFYFCCRDVLKLIFLLLGHGFRFGRGCGGACSGWIHFCFLYKQAFLIASLLHYKFFDLINALDCSHL